jgi:hypothetical protein
MLATSARAAVTVFERAPSPSTTARRLTALLRLMSTCKLKDGLVSPGSAFALFKRWPATHANWDVCEGGSPSEARLGDRRPVDRGRRGEGLSRDGQEGEAGESLGEEHSGERGEVDPDDLGGWG